MAKNKKFRDWMEEDEWEDRESDHKKKDSKRYDAKKDNVRNARKQKRNLKDSFFDG